MTWEPGLRSDGFVIVREGRHLRATDLFTGREAPFAWEDFSDEVAFAIVPGDADDRRDPWTGRLRTASTPATRQPITAPHEAPGSLANDSGDTADSGCSAPAGSGAAAPLLSMLAALALLVGVRRRRTCL
jgi:MYXO-CTERM domain-containing protein